MLAQEEAHNRSTPQAARTPASPTHLAFELVAVRRHVELNHRVEHFAAKVRIGQDMVVDGRLSNIVSTQTACSGLLHSHAGASMQVVESSTCKLFAVAPVEVSQVHAD